MKKVFMPLICLEPLLRASFLVIGLGLSQTLCAQNIRIKATDYQIGLGKTYLFDDYLSPLPHYGNSIRLSNGNIKPLKWDLPNSLETTFKDARWFNQMTFTLTASYGQSLANSFLYYGYTDIRDYLLRQLISTNKWNVSIGPFAAISCGGRYCLQNGNNPGDIDASTDIGASILTSYHLKLWNTSVKLNYQGSLALAGIAFSPEYAESFYEIFYLRNHDNVIKFTSLNNRQNWTQQFSVDIPLPNRISSFRLSYWNEGRVSLLNNIRTRVLTNQLSVGYIRYFHIL